MCIHAAHTPLLQLCNADLHTLYDGLQAHPDMQCIILQKSLHVQSKRLQYGQIGAKERMQATPYGTVPYLVFLTGGGTGPVTQPQSTEYSKLYIMVLVPPACRRDSE